jgi:hypothetical protein
MFFQVKVCECTHRPRLSSIQKLLPGLARPKQESLTATTARWFGRTPSPSSIVVQHIWGLPNRQQHRLGMRASRDRHIDVDRQLGFSVRGAFLD